MTVKELFEAEKIPKDFLLDRTDESSYWQKSYTFMCDIWEKELETLSAKQVSWMQAILDDSVEKRIKEQRLVHPMSLPAS